MSIEKKEFISSLTKAFAKNGLGKMLSLEKSEAFYLLTERMLLENEKYNLTAITDPDMIILNHYVDCATLAARLPKGARIIDVGCGAGFPSLPVAILREDLSITAMDSTAKRVEYVAASADMLGLKNITALTMRAEDGGKDPAMREKFDIATARAVANMRVLAELCLPFIKVGGKMIAMKGKNAEIELKEAKKAIATLGGRDATVENIELISESGEKFTHPLVTVSKKEKTPSVYPRPYAQISKKPL
jgi:16S rRNA (guanine527-N7)-methyltransferase